MSCINSIPLHVGFIYDIENEVPTKFWCVREMRALEISMSKKNKLKTFESCELGGWYTANLSNNCFMKVKDVFQTRIRQDRLEVQVPLILFENQKHDYIGYAPGFGKVGVFVKNFMPKQVYHNCWVTKLDSTIKPKKLQETCKEHEIEWVVGHQKPSELELVDLLNCMHIKIATGIAMKVEKEGMLLWNEKFGLLQKMTEGEQYKVGDWIKFIPAQDFKDDMTVANTMLIKGPNGYEFKAHEGKVYIKFDGHLIQKDDDQFYLEKIGYLEDPKNFLLNIDLNHVKTVIIKFDFNAREWIIRNVAYSYPHLQKYIIPQSIPIPSGMKIVHSHPRVFVQMHHVKSKMFIPPAFAPPVFSSDDVDKLVSDDSEGSVSEDGNSLDGEQDMAPKSMSERNPNPKLTKSDQLGLKIILYKVYLHHKKGLEVPTCFADFGAWLKSVQELDMSNEKLIKIVWNYWTIFKSMEEDGEEFEHFMMRVENEFERDESEIEVDEKEDNFSTSSSKSSASSGSEESYDTLGLLLRKLYLFEREGYKVPESEDKFIGWISTSCRNTLSEEFCEKAWKMRRLFKLASHNEEFMKQLEKEIM